MKNPQGRPHKLPFEVRRLIGQRVANGELTYRQAAKKYNVSGGAVNAYVKAYKAGKLQTPDARRSVITLAPDERKKTYYEMELEKEVKILKAELGDLYLQMQLVKKAEAYKRWLKDEISSVVTVENLDQYKKDAG